MKFIRALLLMMWLVHPPTCFAAEGPAAQPSPAASVAPGDEADELIQKRRADQKIYGAMNETNPLSDQFDYKAFKDKLSAALHMSPQTLDRITSSKTGASLMAYASEPKVRTDWSRIVDSPIRNLWIWVQAGWFVIFLVLRAWRLEAAETFSQRLVEKAWVYSAFVLTSLLVIPWVLFGPPYFRVFSGALEIVMGA
jgi:hypothetical protein